MERRRPRTAATGRRGSHETPRSAHPPGRQRDGAAAAVVLAAIVLAAVAGPVIRAVTDLIEVLAIDVLVVLALASSVALMAYRARQRRADRAGAVAAPRPVPWRAAGPLPAPRRSTAALPASGRPAIGQSREIHLHLHGVTAEEGAPPL